MLARSQCSGTQITLLLHSCGAGRCSGSRLDVNRFDVNNDARVIIRNVLKMYSQGRATHLEFAVSFLPDVSYRFQAYREQLTFRRFRIKLWLV